MDTDIESMHTKAKKPFAWACKTCNKIDWADTNEQLAKPEHISYRGVDLGTCKGEMIPLYLDFPFRIEKEMLIELDSFVYKTKSLQNSELRNKLILKINEFLHENKLDGDKHNFVDFNSKTINP
jgi:hypothetical protein